MALGPDDGGGDGHWDLKTWSRSRNGSRSRNWKSRGVVTYKVAVAMVTDEVTVVVVVTMVMVALSW